jgi:prepilin-type N-terminal cleavage/methylation domain-containing protein
MTRRDSEQGFTLVEMIVALTLSAIVIGAAAMFMSAPVDAHFAQRRRVELMDDSAVVFRQLREDLSRAVPRSVRVRNSGTRAIVEMLVADAALFHTSGTMPNVDLELDTNALDSKFSVYPHLANPGEARYLAIGYTGTGYDPYRLTGVTPGIAKRDIAVIANGSDDRIQLAPNGVKFGRANGTVNPARIYFVSGPVTYICNSAANVAALQRYEGYPVTAGIPTSESSAQLASSTTVSVVATDVASCSFKCPVTVNTCTDQSLSAVITLRRTADTGNEVIRSAAAIAFDNRP